MKKIRFGVFSTAKIGMKKVIPAMQKGTLTEVSAISSRSIERAKNAARKLEIPKTYGSYEELLADPEIDAIYNPLPNHLHVPWSIQALEAGKHVLCEKPISLTSSEAQKLLDASEKNPDLKVMEAFMYRHHPRWQKTKEWVDEGRIGELNTVHSYFSYYNDNPDDIRNQAEIGGGGMMDIGCYCISAARFLFGGEPQQAESVLKMDSEFQTDKVASALLDFGSGTSVFTCSTQSSPHQYVQIFGTKGHILLNTPFTPAPDEQTEIHLYKNGSSETFSIEPHDQYTVQGDLFARSILEDTPVPTPLQDAVDNMKVIEQLLRQ
ncbi:MAG: Gfo/Idh/MocA family oxidoreductase [Balneolaceae bacterium]